MHDDNNPYNNFKAGCTFLVFGKNKIQKQKTVIEYEDLKKIVTYKGKV
jgi:hypothetical protein